MICEGQRVVGVGGGAWDKRVGGRGDGLRGLVSLWEDDKDEPVQEISLRLHSQGLCYLSMYGRGEAGYCTSEDRRY